MTFFVRRSLGFMSLLGSVILIAGLSTLDTSFARTLAVIGVMALGLVGWRLLVLGVFRDEGGVVRINRLWSAQRIDADHVVAIRIVSLLPVKGMEAFQLDLGSDGVQLVWSDAPGYDELPDEAIARYRAVLGLGEL